jgi:predicted protein tyrosine phosphatase
MGAMRSRTAAVCTKTASTNVRYAGTSSDAVVKVTEEDIHWADLIVCMENSHRNKISRKVKGVSKKIQVWGIPDIYYYLEDELCHIVKRKYIDLVEPLINTNDTKSNQ